MAPVPGGVVDDAEYDRVGGVDHVCLVGGFDRQEVVVVAVGLAEGGAVDGRERV